MYRVRGTWTVQIREKKKKYEKKVQMFKEDRLIQKFHV